jgi:hypothetical protein
MVLVANIVLLPIKSYLSKDNYKMELHQVLLSLKIKINFIGLGYYICI